MPTRKKIKVLVLVDQRLVPKYKSIGALAKRSKTWTMEADVLATLLKLGYHVEVLGVQESVFDLIQKIDFYKPKLVFNLLEDFNFNPYFEQHIAGLLELNQQKYSGCNPLGLGLARNKVKAKQIVAGSGFLTPKYCCYLKGGKFKSCQGIETPIIVKSLAEEGSVGLSQNSVINNLKQLKHRVALLHKKYDTDVIVEEYIAGREVYVAVLGNNNQVTAFTPWELRLNKAKNLKYNIATRNVKWNKSYQKKLGVVTSALKLPAKELVKIKKSAVQIFKNLGLSGYARIDFRLTSAGDLYFIEANPNPNLCKDEDFARSARQAGLNYDRLIEKIVKLGLQYNPV